MSTAFLWSLGLSNHRFIGVILFDTIVVEILYKDAAFDRASVSEFPDDVIARDFALGVTEYWGGKRGYTLISIFYHSDPEEAAIAGSLRTMRDLSRVNEDLLHLCEVVVSRFHKYGKVLR